MSVPTCKSCGIQHYNFKPCEVAKKEQFGYGVKQPHAELRSDYGLIPWGDRLESFSSRGGTLWLADPQRSVHGGNVIEPEEWHGEEKAE